MEKSRVCRQIFYAVCRNHSLLFIPAAEARQRTGRSRIGSSSGMTCLTRMGFADRWSSYLARLMRPSARAWRASGKIETGSISSKILPLPHLAAVLEDSLFVGHDSGISHIAAAVGAQCILLFGPTDPAIWAPANENETVLRARRAENLAILESSRWKPL